MKKKFFKIFLQGTFKLFSSEFLHYWLCKRTPLQRKKYIYIYSFKWKLCFKSFYV